MNLRLGNPRAEGAMEPGRGAPGGGAAGGRRAAGQNAAMTTPADEAPASGAAARLFLALWPDAAVREALAAWFDGWRWSPGASLVRREKLHVTLHFLGDVPVWRLGELTARVGVGCERFELRFGRAELWPHGLAVLRPEADPPALQRLHANLGRALRALGMQTEERRFKPHATLARRAGGSVPPATGPSIAWAVDGYVLVESQRAGGGRYRVVRSFGAAGYPES